MLFLKKPHFLCVDSLIFLLESCILFLFIISYYALNLKCYHYYSFIFFINFALSIQLPIGRSLAGEGVGMINPLGVWECRGRHSFHFSYLCSHLLDKSSGSFKTITLRCLWDPWLGLPGALILRLRLHAGVVGKVSPLTFPPGLMQGAYGFKSTVSDTCKTNRLCQ